jgi:hypothetical protein
MVRTESAVSPSETESSSQRGGANTMPTDHTGAAEAKRELEAMLNSDEKNRWTFRGIQIDYETILEEGIESWYEGHTIVQGFSEYDASLEDSTAMFKAYDILRGYPYSRETITELALSDSLCPIHFVDYAICFDDQFPECSQVREIHPNHDT